MGDERVPVMAVARRVRKKPKNYEFARNARSTRWFRVYRNRIALGLEKCRNPDGRCTRTDLEFDHLVPWVLGGRAVFENATLLCHGCNNAKRAEIGGRWAGMISLAEEERRAPEERRWSLCWEIQPIPEAQPAKPPEEGRGGRSGPEQTRSRPSLTAKIDPAAIAMLRERVS